MKVFEADPSKLGRRKLIDQLFRSACFLAASIVVVVLIVLIGTILSGASTALTFESSLPQLVNDTGLSEYDGVTNEKSLTLKILQGTGPCGSTAQIWAIDEAGSEQLIGTGSPRTDGSFVVNCDPIQDGRYDVHFLILSDAGDELEKSRSIPVVVDTVPPSGLEFDTDTLGDQVLNANELESFVIGGLGIEEPSQVKVGFKTDSGGQLEPVTAINKQDGKWRIPVTSLARVDAGLPTPPPKGELIVEAIQQDLAGNFEKPVRLTLKYDKESESPSDLQTVFDDDDVDLSFVAITPVVPTNFSTFLKSHHFDNAPEESGIFRALVGSMLLCGVCALFTIPIGIGTAIYLEDFKPQNKILRVFHGFIQLNISNLAGVPSIVYGILGVTAFVYMFNVFSVKTVDTRPEYEFGDNYVYQMETIGGQICTFSAPESKEAFIEIVESREVNGDEGKFMLQVVDSAEGLTTEEKYNAVVKGSLRAQASVIDSQHYWYYISLPFGKSFLAAGLTLGLVVLPIIIIASQEAIRAVPDSLREASMGMGATKWQTVRTVVLPSATPGIMTGTILALSRAIGEAAPILAVMGGVLSVLPKNLMETSSALPILIYKWAKDAEPGFHSLSAAAIVVLLLMLLLMNSIAIVIRYQAEKRKK